MKWLMLVLRVLFGGIFVVFGLHHYLDFLPLPEPELPEPAQKFGAALAETGYMWDLIKGTEIVGGILVLTGFMAPLGLVLLGPVVVNITMFQAVLGQDRIIMTVLPVLYILLVLGYFRYFYPLFTPMPRPFGSRE